MLKVIIISNYNYNSYKINLKVTSYMTLIIVK